MKNHIKLYNVFLLAAILLCNVVYAQNNARKEYIRKYKELAVEQMNKYGIPASITLAQGCLESADGTSRLAVKAHNHFGIKCKDWNGKKIYHNDDEKGECFRKYRNVEESYKDHSEFLRNGLRYQSLFDLKQTDYKAWAHGLKAAGYATNPKYATMLIEIIEEYKLYQYDGKTGNKKEKPGKAVESSTIYKYSLDRQIYSEDGTPYIIATGVETYDSIAKEYNLFRSEILKFNNLKKKDIPRNMKIEAGTVVYIAKRKK